MLISVIAQSCFKYNPNNFQGNSKLIKIPQTKCSLIVWIVKEWKDQNLRKQAGGKLSQAQYSLLLA